MKLLVFTGAGASAELGIPTMRPMSEAFLRHLQELGWTAESLKIPSSILAMPDRDMEHLIDELDRLRHGFQSQRSLGMLHDEKLLENLEAFAREAEWFVQNLCEQLRRHETEAIWAPVFRAISRTSSVTRATFITSNYDRSIEQGARCGGVELDDGFSGKQHDEVSNWVDFSSDSRAVLVKAHGSTDWYQTEDGRPVKLRHAIPVFGKLRLQASDRDVLTAALVLPSREKKITTPPFPQITAAMHTYARSADAAVFIGTSLRDPHLRVLFKTCSDRIPTAYVSRTSPAVDIGSAVRIPQSASYFIASSLPRVISEGKDVSNAFKALSHAEQTESVLPAIHDAWLSSGSDRLRCTAIEALIRLRFSTHTSEILRLLETNSPSIRKFALGLVRDSYGSDDISSRARSLAEETNDSDLKTEVALLDELLARDRSSEA
jgi:hypothetical protein